VSDLQENGSEQVAFCTLDLLWSSESETSEVRELMCLCMFIYIYRLAPVSVGNTFQDLLQLCEIADDIKCYILVTYINTVKFDK
jgi:hypothetical protein